MVHGSGLLGGILLARILDPLTFGVLQGFKLLYVAADACHLGARQGLQILLPRRRGQDSPEGIATFVGTGLLVNLLLQATFAAALFAWASGLSPGLGMVRWGYQASALSVLLLGVYATLDVVLLGSEEIRVRAKVQGLRAITHFVVLIPSAILLGPLAFWLADWVASWVIVLQASGVGGAAFRRADRAEVVPLFRVGFPLFLGGQLQNLLTYADRIVILGLLGSESLAYYSVATSSVGGLVVAVQGVSSIWAVRSMRLLSQGDEPLVRQQADECARGFGWFAVVLGLAGMLFLDLLVEWFLPRYRTSLPIALALSPTVYVHGMAGSIGSIFYHRGWEAKLLPWNLACAALSLGSALWAVERGFGVVGVAAIASAVRVATNALVCYLGWRLLGDGVGAAIRRIARHYVPLGIALVGLVATTGAANALGLGGAAGGLRPGILGLLLILTPALRATWRDLALGARWKALRERKGF